MNGHFGLKSGTIVMFFFILVVGYAGFYLVSGNISDYSSTASEERELAMKCTELEIEFVEVRDKGESVKVFFRSNRDLSGVKVGLEGTNTSHLVEDVNADSIQSTAFNTSDYSNIYIETDMCENAYWWQ